MTKKTGIWRIGDSVLIALVLAVALGFFGVRALVMQNGCEAVVTTPDGSFTLSLSEKTSRTVHGKDGHTVTITVVDGTVGFVSADCPDQVCVHSGRLKNAGETAACVPAGVSVRVTGEGVDAIAR